MPTFVRDLQKGSTLGEGVYKIRGWNDAKGSLQMERVDLDEGGKIHDVDLWYYKRFMDVAHDYEQGKSPRYGKIKREVSFDAVPGGF